MNKYDIIGAMEVDVKSAVAEIESTTDLLERALKLSGLVTTLFQRRGFPLVVAGTSVVLGAIQVPSNHQIPTNIKNHHIKPPNADFFAVAFLFAFHWAKPEFLSIY